MKNLILSCLFFGYCIMLGAQNQPQIGDELQISEPTAQSYRYVNFPQKNILVKRGKVPNYKSVVGNNVIVEDVITKDENTYVILKKKDGSKFFGFLNSVKANYSKSIDAGELIIAK